VFALAPSGPKPLGNEPLLDCAFVAAAAASAFAASATAKASSTFFCSRRAP
jgi:hypothetical protein